MLFFEPLTIEDVLNICDAIEPDGVIVQFGGQTPLNLARGLTAADIDEIEEAAADEESDESGGDDGDGLDSSGERESA